MASDASSLTDLRRISGGKLLKMTDDVGFCAVGAAWVFDADTQHWRYLLVSPMIDSKGPRWVYERLLQVFRKLHLPEGIVPLDIMIVSPRELTFQNFPFAVSAIPDDPSAVSHIENVTIDNLHITHMAIYRMGPMQNNGGDRAKGFESRVAALLAA